MKWLLAFLAGFIATLAFHQPVLWLFHLAGLTTRSPYAMKPVPPFGVPSVISLAFWGGVWGIIMIAAIVRSKAYYLAAALFGAGLPTIVAAIIARFRGTPIPMTGANIALGLCVNAAWGLGTAVLYRLFTGRLRR